jgi:hypothetical protein
MDSRPTLASRTTTGREIREWRDSGLDMARGDEPDGDAADLGNLPIVVDPGDRLGVKDDVRDRYGRRLEQDPRERSHLRQHDCRTRPGVWGNDQNLWMLGRR